MKKPRFVILTEAIRRDNHLPLRHFKKMDVFHFYQSAPYGELTSGELKSAKRYHDLNDLYRKVMAIKPDIIQGSEPWGSRKMLALSYLAYKISKQLDIPLVFPVLENRPLEKRLSFIKRLVVNIFFKWYAKRASKIFYLNRGAHKNLVKLGVEKSKLVPFLWGIWGVDTNLFKPQKYHKQFPTILFGGRLDRAKGVEYLFYAFKKVKKEIPETRLILFGSGELEAWAKDFVEKNGWQNDVEFTGIIKTRDLPEQFAKADIFCCLSITLNWWEEQIGMVNLQAMSCGVPVVSTLSGAIPEYVPDGVAGILVPEKDIDKTSSAIIKLLQDKKLRDKLGEQGRQFVIQNYSEKDNILKAEKILLDLIKKNE